MLQWNDLRAIIVLFLPVLVIGFITALHFLNEVPHIYSRYIDAMNKNKEIPEAVDKSQNSIPSHPIHTRLNTEVIYRVKQKKEVTIKKKQEQ